MVSLNPDSIQTIQLTKEEQAAILQHCSNTIPYEMMEQIYSATDGVLMLDKQQCRFLRSAINMRIEQLGDINVIDILGNISNRLSSNPITRKIAEESKGKPFESIEQLQEFANRAMNEQNNSPDQTLGGLTPTQMSRLLYKKWNMPDSSLKLNDNLSFDDVCDAPLYHNACVLLKELINLKDKNTATAKGYLTRKVVERCKDSFIIDSHYTKITITYSKVLNESDLHIIWMTRLLCEMSKLIRKEKNKFKITKKGKELLEKQNAGKLYHLLFSSYFIKFNLGFSDRLPDLYDIQGTMAFSFYQVQQLAKKQVEFKHIYRRLVLPAVLDVIDSGTSDFIKADLIIRIRVIEPMEYAGLLKCKREKVKFMPKIVSLEATELFGRFVGFEWYDEIARTGMTIK